MMTALVGCGIEGHPISGFALSRPTLKLCAAVASDNGKRLCRIIPAFAEKLPGNFLESVQYNK